MKQAKALYILAMSATRTIPVGEKKIESIIVLACGEEIATSEEEAKQRGLEAAYNRWPSADGWIGHGVAATEFDRFRLVDALNQIPETPLEGEVDGQETEKLVAM
jgi:hypothetical protein